MHRKELGLSQRSRSRNLGNVYASELHGDLSPHKSAAIRGTQPVNTFPVPSLLPTVFGKDPPDPGLLDMRSLWIASCGFTSQVWVIAYLKALEESWALAGSWGMTLFPFAPPAADTPSFPPRNRLICSWGSIGTSARAR